MRWRVFFTCFFAAGLLAVSMTGCGSSEPPQTKVPDDKVKEIMTKAKDQASREGGDRRMRK